MSARGQVDTLYGLNVSPWLENVPAFLLYINNFNNIDYNEMGTVGEQIV